jgi:hypothetical protein
MSTAIAHIDPPQEQRAVILTPTDMLGRAVDQGASIEVLERLMALQERHAANEARKAFNLAIAAAKAEIPVIKKTRRVGYKPRNATEEVSYYHEDLGEIAATIDPILSRHGLSYRFRTSQSEGGLITVACILSHRDGHSEENSLSAGRDESGSKNNIQAVGSTQTYLQRYTLKAALGLAAARDDDGVEASAPKLISAEDAQALRDKMVEAGLSEERFCARLKVEKVEQLPAERYDEADRRIMDYARQKAAPHAG